MSEAEECAVMTPPPALPVKKKMLILLACYVYVHYFQPPERPTGGESEFLQKVQRNDCGDGDREGWW